MDSKEFFYKLGILIYKIDGIYDEYIKNNGISASNLLWILYALNDGKVHSQKQISSEWSIPRTTTNTIIKDLENAGYVRLEQIKGEKRELKVVLTSGGKEYANKLLNSLYEKEREVFSELKDPEKLITDLNDLANVLINISKKEEEK